MPKNFLVDAAENGSGQVGAKVYGNVHSIDLAALRTALCLQGKQCSSSQWLALGVRQCAFYALCATSLVFLIIYSFFWLYAASARTSSAYAEFVQSLPSFTERDRTCARRDVQFFSLTVLLCRLHNDIYKLAILYCHSRNTLPIARTIDVSLDGFVSNFLPPTLRPPAHPPSPILKADA